MIRSPRLALLTGLALLAGCETSRGIRSDLAVIPQNRPAASGPVAPDAPAPDDPAASAWRIESQALPPVDSAAQRSVERSFNVVFDQAPVAAIADAVLGQSLRRSYRLDPSVQGSLTLSLTGRMSEAQALATFDRALRSVSAALVAEGQGFAIVPAAQAARLNAPPVAAQDGAEILAGSAVYQARSIGAAEIARLLEPLAGDGATVRADPGREQVFISGDPMTVNALVRTARSLDVDWLQGKSLQFFPVRYASPTDIASEIQQVFGGPDGPMGSQIQFIELNRLNGLLVIARSPAGLDRAAEWIQRFDRAPPPASRRLRSIPLANLEADQFVTTLSALLGTGSGAPHTTAGGQEAPPAPTPDAPGGAPTLAAAAGAAGALRLTADARTNSLILLADDAEYRNVLDIVRELDAPPPQVLIEATIAEVTLNDRLRFGVQWFFDDNDLTGGFSSGSDDAAASSFPGFSLRYLDLDVRAVLNALSTVTDVELISTPRILVLSNESAELQVGDQVPIITQTAVGLNDDSRVLNSVQYRDTGVVLSVTPRVSESGRMFIQIEQEVSEVAGTTTSDIDSPTIQQRRLSTRIQVEDGQLVVLGGLLRSSRSLGDTGVPYLSRIPALGALFRSRDTTQRQTELVMFLRPTVIRARSDIDAVTNEMVGRLQALGLPVETPPAR
ncbi:MAG: type II secretion system secretin GspD [Brevundimonas sp.]|uniref:type II secretion system secretin GspD n=1 Tax=Brevundimonas sp. TaxID=1871086 RepID=UPI002627290C|nr:type II secretion system secretin GspD [Brevundimonas sp.]MDI6623495.1 type II secretion system secretin GspD [Brevundimonas sp.]MDQ7812062.1 type II secretion system secretin GspD [Brevundimonas sp.]